MAPAVEGHMYVMFLEDTASGGTWEPVEKSWALSDAHQPSHVVYKKKPCL